MAPAALHSRLSAILSDKRVADVIVRPGISLRYFIHDEMKEDEHIVTDSDFNGLAELISLHPDKKDDDAQWEFEDKILRCNLMVASNVPQICMRVQPKELPTFDSCNFPENEALRKSLLSTEQGLIFLVGTPGSGKSTTCAALIREYAQIHARHIITYEDPIEFRYPVNLKSLVSQRDMRHDMVSELAGLKSNLRQKPSLLLIQEIRQPEEAVLLLMLASLGLRVITTIHAGSADAAISSFLKWLPKERWAWGCYMLSQHLICAIAQRLEESTTEEAKRRYVLHQVLWAKPTTKSLAVSAMISKAADDERELDGLRSEIRNGGDNSLHITWQQSLDRWQKKDVTFADTLVEALTANAS